MTGEVFILARGNDEPTEKPEDAAKVRRSEAVKHGGVLSLK
jgi:hypothetical protein